jgi:MinD-like ATPase involved in chromosome partitioning or flagellar assembly
VAEVTVGPDVVAQPRADTDPTVDVGSAALSVAELESLPAVWLEPVSWGEPVPRAAPEAAKPVSHTEFAPARFEPAPAAPAVRVIEHAADLISMEFATSSVLDQLAPVERVKPRSTHGVRGAMNKLGFRFGLSAAEERAEQRRALIRTQVTAPHQIAVMSVKGGVGRTTTTAALGSTFAGIRADRVVAFDAGGGFGDLAARTRTHPQGLTMQDLVRGPRLDSFAAVQAFATTNSADLDVVASPWSSAADVELTVAEYAIGFGELRKHYNLLLADCGTGLSDPATIAVLSTSNSVVVVTSATVGGVSGAVATLNWLFSHGLRHLVAKAVVALVHQRPDHPVVDIGEVENIFASARRPTVVIPFDSHLAEGSEIDMRLLRAETRLAFEELAVDMVAHFPSYREAMR